MNCPVKKTNKILSIVCGCLSFGICFAFNASEVAAQRDPFLQKQTIVVAPKPKSTTSSSSTPTSGTPKVTIVKAVPAAVAVPPIEQRIASYKELRLRSAQLGIPAPKPTTVLTLDEVQIIGIFHTPRGYAAMVEATPINLSYTIYPGEKFFNGQLVAIEDNRLVFRRVTQFNNGKSVIAAESKSLRQQTLQEVLTPTIEKAANDSPKSATQSATTNPTIAPSIGVNPSSAVQMADSSLNGAKPVESDVTLVITPQPKSVKPSKANRIEPRKVSPKSKNAKKVAAESQPVQDAANDVQNMNAPVDNVESNDASVSVKPTSKTPKTSKSSKAVKSVKKVETPKVEAPKVKPAKVEAPKPAVTKPARKPAPKPVAVTKTNAAKDAGDSVPTDISSPN